MKIRLDQVDEPFEWRESVTLSAADVDRPEVVDLGEIEVRGRISPAIEGLVLRVSLKYRQTLRCVRCLEPVTVPAEGNVELLLELGGEETSAAERALEARDLGVLFLDRRELDTRPFLIEQVQLGVPMKPLCKEDCAGLCPVCGTDRNAGPCRCEVVPDPRWSALAALRQERPDRG